jgi:hypothetical protein
VTGEVRCSFELRTPAPDHPGMFNYTRLWIDSYHQDGSIHTAHPPTVGDTVWLVARDIAGETYRVIARDWSYPAYGSGDWPRGQKDWKRGPILRCLVELAEGFIQDEAPYADETEKP